jgi:hypothetical protein
VSVKVGVPQAKLAALVAWETSPEFSDRERAALRFTTAVVRDDREVTDADWAQLRAHFSEPEVVELPEVWPDEALREEEKHFGFENGVTSGQALLVLVGLFVVVVLAILVLSRKY